MFLLLSVCLSFCVCVTVCVRAAVWRHNDDVIALPSVKAMDLKFDVDVHVSRDSPDMTPLEFFLIRGRGYWLESRDLYFLFYSNFRFIFVILILFFVYFCIFI